MAKITVLTAVYNAEPYLRECLDSLRRQSLSDAQFVCIDDASTDRSPQILSEYAALDPRFTVLHMDTNSGHAAARNRGLQAATGQYVTMLDADDWLSDDALALACAALESSDEADCAVFRLKNYDQATAQTSDYRHHAPAMRTLTGSEAFRLSLDWTLHGLYAIRTDIHRQYPYDTSTRLYSDENTTRLHYLHSRRVVQCGGIYYYRRHAASMTRRATIHIIDRLEADLAMKRTLEQEHVSDTDLSAFETARWHSVIDTYYFYHHHRSSYTTDERRQIRHRFAAILGTIEPQRVDPALRHKFGYWPVRAYTAFRLLEHTYFQLQTLRRALRPSPEQ